MVSRTHAPFFMVTKVGAHETGAWQWVTWSHGHASMHVALKIKAAEIGAKGYDSGQSSHEIAGRCVYGSPTAFARETR